MELLPLCDGARLLAHNAPLSAFLAPFDRLFRRIGVGVGAVELAEGDEMAESGASLITCGLRISTLICCALPMRCSRWRAQSSRAMPPSGVKSAL